MSAQPDFRHIESCLAVTDDVIQGALSAARSMTEPTPRMKTLALIERMAEVAKPSRAAPKILIVLAHLALKDWLDGLLRVRLIGDPEVSVLELLVDDGLSTSRILGPLRIDVPFDEFRRSLELRPEFVLPLVIDGQLEERRVELQTAPQSRHNTVPPNMNVVTESLLPMRGTSGRLLPPIVSQIPPSLAKPAASQPTAPKPRPPGPPPRRPPPPKRPAAEATAVAPERVQPPPPRHRADPPPLPRMPGPGKHEPAKADPAPETPKLDIAPPEEPIPELPVLVIAPPEEPIPELPELVIAPPEEPIPEMPELVIAPPDADPGPPSKIPFPPPDDAPAQPEQRRYKAISLPPHMKAALSSIKKKS